MSDDYTEEEVTEALAVLEKILQAPTTREADTRVKRRIRVEIRRLLAAAGTED